MVLSTSVGGELIRRAEAGEERADQQVGEQAQEQALEAADADIGGGVHAEEGAGETDGEGPQDEQIVQPQAGAGEVGQGQGQKEHGNLEYIGCDLHQFEKLAPIIPTPDEIDMLRRRLLAIRDLPPSAQLSELNKSLIGLFPSQKDERQLVLEILGFAGILKPHSWQSFFDAWVRPADILEPDSYYKKEWHFPTSGWTGKDGINESAVRFWFPQIR